jgi:hypothetical protein
LETEKLRILAQYKELKPYSEDSGWHVIWSFVGHREVANV